MDEKNSVVVGPGACARAAPSASKSSDGDRPLLKLMKIVIHIVTKEEKTVLTNCHLLDILQKEFNIDTRNKTKLEIDIYLDIIKNFLKTWPRWDEFDKLIKESRRDPKKTIDSILSDECQDLHKYLKRILSMTEGQMTHALEKLERNKMKQQMQKQKKEKDIEEGEVIMEVTCSRGQLNELVYTHPVMNSIFHISNNTKNGSTKTFSLAEIFNWPNVSISISLPWLECFRRNSSHFERILKNLKLHTVDVDAENLSKEIYWRNHQAKKWSVKKVSIVNLFNDLLEYIKSADMGQQHKQNRQGIMEVLSQFKHDLVGGPDLITLGAEYQFFLSRYKYVRHLSKKPPLYQGLGLKTIQNDNAENFFDLRLEETISPAQKFQINSIKCDHSPNSRHPQLTETDLKRFWDTNNDWLIIECLDCNLKFKGFLTWHFLQQHFIENHSLEMDWTCQNCKSIYSMQDLANNRWFHKCVLVS
ncbi:hypothetical protein EVAR_85461_1 [Eumeta japonica]|uniref:Uncharacterized protein n=1 Tax=Eumeta variegata TaxID=151549 RepID=A0A4C1VE26_EUMVA|nr:hypothetical protein EVAR_85461_1 [Eumeta japonica]